MYIKKVYSAQLEMLPKTLLIFVLSLLHVTYGRDGTTYDFIIVGAGSAGATLAARLSEGNFAKVLLLEAGPKPPMKSEIPLLFSNFESNTQINWNYTIEPEDGSCRGLKNKRCPYFMGRTLGGSSQINYMLYVRGSQIDYNLWEKNGADGWGYEDVLPFFKKAEGVKIFNESLIDEDFHGKKGPLTVSVNSYSTVLKEAYLKSTEELGYPTVDYNGKNQRGFSVAQVTVQNGYRCSTEKAYLRPAESRHNLKVITGAYVTKIDIKNKVAKGVFYIKDNGSGNQTYHARAGKEVIVCGGAIKSPQILMLSGIGPKQHLKDMNITIVANLPVGLNLQDHVATAGAFFTVDAPSVPTFSDLINYTSLPNYEFPKTLTGILSTPGVLEVLGYLKSPFETEKGDYNDVQFFFLSNIVFQKDFNDEIKSFIAKNGYFDKPAFLIVPTVLHPKSRGNITLRSNIPTDPPVIQMNFYTDPQDIKVMVYAMKKAFDLVKTTKAFTKLKPQVIGPIPGCEIFSLASDEYFECIARLLTVSLYHACGTCKMGKVNDPTTVVDSKLRVKGIARLRVVDASIMPRIASANLNAPTIMIAEKAADMIKKTYPKY